MAVGMLMVKILINNKKKKKKKQEVESLHDIDSTVKFGVREADGKLPNGSQKESESTREQGNEGNINAGMEEGRKQKSGKKHKVSTSSFSSYKGEANNGKDLEQQKEMEKTSCNGFEGENGGLGSLAMEREGVVVVVVGFLLSDVFTSARC